MNLVRKAFPRIRRAAEIFLGIPATVVAVYFIASLAFSYQAEIRTSFSHLKYPLFFLGVIFLSLFFLLKSYVWHLILQKNKKSIPLARSIFLFTYAEIRRYIPSNIFAPLSRYAYFRSSAATSREMIRLIVVEHLIYVLSCITVVVLGLFFVWNQVFEYYASHIQSVFPLSTLSFYIATISTLFAIALLFLNRYVKSPKISSNLFPKYGDIFAISFLGWTFFGIGSYLIAASLTYLDPLYIPQAAYLFIFSWLAGYLVFFVPMGFGVREALVVALLFAVVPAATALTISLFVRVGMIAAELVLLGTFQALSKFENVRLIHRLRSVPGQFVILAVAIISYITYFTYVTFEKHENFFTGRFDLGNMDQVVWNTFRGRPFVLTNPDSTNTVSRLAIHADFILVFLAPFYRIWSDPRMLLLIQTVTIALGAFFIYVLSKSILQNRNISVVFALSYLLNPFVQKQNLYDFHAASLATTFLLGAFYFLHKKKLFWFFIFLLVSVLCKENIFLISAMFGVYLVVHKKRNLGAILCIASLVAFYALVARLIPDARGTSHFALSYFQEFGDSPLLIARSIFLQPQKTLPLLLTWRNFSYIKMLLLPVGFSSLLSPLYLIFAAPDLAINLLSKNHNLTSLNYHYAATIIPFIYISSIHGTKMGIEFVSKKLVMRRETAQKIAVYYLLFFSLYSAWAYGALPGSRYASLEIFRESTPDRSQIATYLSHIPKRFSVAATNNLGAHLSHRQRIYTIPNGIDRADIVLFLLTDEFAQPSLAEQKRTVERLRASDNYQEIYHVGEFVAFRRIR